MKEYNFVNGLMQKIEDKLRIIVLFTHFSLKSCRFDSFVSFSKKYFYDSSVYH